VVRDTPDLIAQSWQAGTGDELPDHRTSALELLAGEQPELLDSIWVDTDVLMLYLPGVAHSVYVMWEEGHAALWCWYINPQDPLQRTRVGLNTMDHILDLVVSPDRGEWWWKDEGDLTEALRVGLYDWRKVEAIRAESLRALHLLQAPNSPYDRRWKDWSLPEGWESLEYMFHQPFLICGIFLI
jgi:hypothetical protein